MLRMLLRERHEARRFPARTSSTGAVAAMRPAQERLTIAAFDAIRSAAARHLCFDIADLTPADPRSRGFFGVGAAFP
jgi:hypothetical protein